jgi:hypothetical protein
MTNFKLAAVAVAAAIPLHLIIANAAQAETWYCTLQNDPTIATYGVHVTPYQINGNKIIDLEDKKFLHEISRDFDKTYEFQILRNDENYLIANRQYNWQSGVNIDTIAIEKRHGDFLSIGTHTWESKSDTYKGSCTNDTTGLTKTRRDHAGQ